MADVPFLDYVADLPDATQVTSADRMVVLQSGAIRGLPPVSMVQSTDTSTTIGLFIPPGGYQKITYAPASTTDQPIRFAGCREVEHDSAQAIGGAGHLGGGLDRFIQTGTGDPNLAVAHEAKWENNHASATISLGKGHETQLAANAGTITYWAGITSQILSNAGTITVAVLHDADVAANAGTISLLIDYWSRDVSGHSGITAKYGFRQDDPGKLNVSASPWIDQSIQRATPTSGSTVTIGALKSWLILRHGATIAALTVAFPAAASIPDGCVFEITTAQEVTALTLTCSGAAFIVWVDGATMQPGQTLRFRWDATDGWLRTMSAY